MKISIIIPTYNRYDSLKQMLQALAEQDYPKDAYEVFVVDDGSKDNTAEIANEAFPFALHYVRQENAGATVARNRAADMAQGELLVFLDDDIHVVPGFLTAFAQAHQTDRLIAVGYLLPMEREGMSIFEQMQVPEANLMPRADGRETIPIPYTNCLTGMFSVKRSHFYEIGRLQDLVGDGRVAWGDVDFGYRASKLGFQFVCSTGAVGYHDDYSVRDFNLCAKRWQRTSESAVKLFKVYPEILPAIPMFEDKTPIVWGKDPAKMAIRKLLRQVASTKPVIWTMEKSVPALEKRYPSSRILLGLFYRWVLGGYMFRGFREGLAKYGDLN